LFYVVVASRIAPNTSGRSNAISQKVLATIRVCALRANEYGSIIKSIPPNWPITDLLNSPAIIAEQTVPEVPFSKLEGTFDVITVILQSIKFGVPEK